MYRIRPKYTKRNINKEVKNFFQLDKKKECKKDLFKISEDVLHIQCVQWFYFQYGNTGAILHHSPNENPYGERLQMIKYNTKMQKMGRQVGEPDIKISYNSQTLYIELKSIDGRLSLNQKNLIERYKNTGFEVHICRTIEEFENIVNVFMKQNS